MSLLEVINLNKIYYRRSRNLVALDGLSFSLNSGEAVGILGPVGSGKSTLFRVLAGLSHLTAGEAYLNDRPIADPKSRVGVGFVPESPGFPREMTTFETLRISARLDSVPEEEVTERVQIQLERLELSKWADTSVSKLSREMIRRLALGAALVSSPNLLIVDEPPDRVPAVERAPYQAILKRVRAEGVTILHLAHTVSLIEKTVDRVLILDRGAITRDMLLSDLIDKRLLVEFEAEIGERLVELPAGLGRVVSISRKRLIVEIDDESSINGIIDLLRMNRIRIHTISRRENTPDSTWISGQGRPAEVAK